LINISRTGFRYRYRHAARDERLTGTMNEIAKKHPRWGYRLVWGAMRKTDEDATIKRVYRLWCRNGLTVPQRRKRRKIRTGARNKPVATTVNHVWTWDFIFDRLASGRQLKCFNVLDERSRECLAIDVQHSIRGGRVKEVLSRLIERYGAPEYIRSDNGPEFIAEVIKKWLPKAGIKTAYIEPGKPWQNPFVESFNATFRNECLNAEIFNNRVEARVVIEAWRKSYNEERTHRSLGYETPASIGACMRKNMPLQSSGFKPGDLST